MTIAAATSALAAPLDRSGMLRTTANPGAIPGAMPAAAPAIDAKDQARIKSTAEDFEAFFVTHAFEDMFADLSSDPLFGGGEAENIFRSFLLQEYGKQVAKAGGIGISDMVQKQLLQLQETSR